MKDHVHHMVLLDLALRSIALQWRTGRIINLDQHSLMLQVFLDAISISFSSLAAAFVAAKRHIHRHRRTCTINANSTRLESFRHSESTADILGENSGIQTILCGIRLLKSLGFSLECIDVDKGTENFFLLLGSALLWSALGFAQHYGPFESSHSHPRRNTQWVR